MNNILGIIDEEHVLTEDDELIIQNNFAKNKDSLYKHIYLSLKDSLNNLELNNIERLLGKPYFDIETEYLSFTNPLENGHCISLETNDTFGYFGSVEWFG